MPAYQSLVLPHPRFSLASFPSPLQRIERLESALRAEGIAVPRIYLKRDDHLSLAFGGNKIRNLEFLIGEALSKGATDVVTAGRQQSNHCRLTAAACVRAGLRAHCVLSGSRPGRATGNLLLDGLLGAEVLFAGSDDRADREAAMDRCVTELKEAGRVPYIIDVGGSSARGALGHALAAGELIDQCDTLGEAAFSIVVATATGGTQAGMLAGFNKLQRTVPVRGIAVAKSADDLRADVVRLSSEVCREMKAPVVPAGIIHIDDHSLGGGYGVATADGAAAARLLARTEGVLLDPVYTAKGFAGFLRLLRDGEMGVDEAVLFIHTGGAPAIFS